MFMTAHSQNKASQRLDANLFDGIVLGLELLHRSQTRMPNPLESFLNFISSGQILPDFPNPGVFPPEVPHFSDLARQSAVPYLFCFSNH